MDEQPPAVLLLDPEPTEELSAALAEFALLAARTVELALRLAARRPPAVAVIDAQIGTHTPEEILTELRAINPGMRAVFLSTRQDPQESGRLTGLGALIPRPVDPERLQQAVRNAVRLHGMSAGVERLRSRTGQFSMTLPAATDPNAPPNSRSPRKP